MQELAESNNFEWAGLRNQNAAYLQRENSAQRVHVPETPPFYFRKLLTRPFKKSTGLHEKVDSPWAWGRDPNSLSLKNTLLLRESSQYPTAPSPQTLPVMSTTAESLSRQDDTHTPSRPLIKKTYPDSGPLLGQSSFRRLPPKKQLRVPRPDFFRCPSKSELSEEPSVETHFQSRRTNPRAVTHVRQVRSVSRIGVNDSNTYYNQPETFQVTEMLLEEPLRTGAPSKPLNVSELLSQDLSGGKRIRFRFEDFLRQAAQLKGLDISAKSEGILLTPKSAFKSVNSRFGSFASQGPVDRKSTRL